MGVKGHKHIPASCVVALCEFRMSCVSSVELPLTIPDKNDSFYTLCKKPFGQECLRLCELGLVA